MHNEKPINNKFAVCNFSEGFQKILGECLEIFAKALNQMELIENVFFLQNLDEVLIEFSELVWEQFSI